METAAKQRLSEIKKMLCREEFLTVEKLSDTFGVTKQTIRRDLNILTEKGIARRRHGGVERLVLKKNQAYISRQVLHSEEKHQIAAEVAKLVPNGATLAFSIGTTPEIVAQALLQHNELKIVTNNLNIAMAMAANPGFEITIAGGRVRNDDRDVLGQSTEAMFSSYKVDIGIFGVAGVDEDGTLLDFHEDEVRTRQTIKENCRLSYLVLDHTKFTRHAHVRGGYIGDVSKIFCDQPPPDYILDLVEQSDTEVITPG
ncbi:MAG: DeoR family transcriptional regulator [Desulfobulbaceae bacterium]|nr:MAG: DeoR family transcriptional regulator [Desulfobulbaceae bacterium]